VWTKINNTLRVDGMRGENRRGNGSGKGHFAGS
jgi:hypothetical protein